MIIVSEIMNINV